MNKRIASIGRYADNDVVINNEYVSGHHAVLEILDNVSLLLKDAGSSNGTFIVRKGRAERVSGAEPVWPEDEIFLGNYRLKVKQLLTMLPSHLAINTGLNPAEADLENRTRPVYQELMPGNHRGEMLLPPDRSQAVMPVSPEQAVAYDSHDNLRQQGAVRVAMGSPVPGEEKVIWSGYSSLAYWILGMLWSGFWILIWLTLTFLIALPFIALAFLATLALIRKILLYINTYYEFTTQRVRRREGVLTLRRNQVELFRLKDFEVVETMFGRLFNYCHIRLVSSERIMPKAVFLAVPNGTELVEIMRRLAQINRAESGIMYLKE